MLITQQVSVALEAAIGLTGLNSAAVFQQNQAARLFYDWCEMIIDECINKQGL